MGKLVELAKAWIAEQARLREGTFGDSEDATSLCPQRGLGDAATTPAAGPRWLPGDLVQVHHQDGRVEAGEVQGLTRIEAPSVCRPGYWYWVLSETGEQWVHESLLELGD